MIARRLVVSIFSIWIATLSGAIRETKRTYTLMNDPIDVVIPAVNKSRVEHCILGLKKYIENIRNIYVISPKKVTDNAIWVDEALFPFDYKGVALHLFKDPKKAEEYLQNGRRRTGWYLQQLLKLYAGRIIPGISSNILIVDSDTLFLQPLSFMNEKNEPIFTQAYEYHKTYFSHAKRLLPGLHRCKKISGIAHHMLLQKDVVEHLLNDIEKEHAMPAWQAMCHCVKLRDDGSLPTTGYSEYEIYFNYFLLTSDQGHIRTLKWQNVSRHHPVWKNSVNQVLLSEFKEAGYHFISRH